MQEKIFEEYIRYILEHKKKPKSIPSFMESIKLKEGTFFKYFNSFDQLEKNFWKSIFENTIEKIQNQEVYQSYSMHEKLLSFYYTWIEELKNYRSYASYVIDEEKIYEFYPSSFEAFKESFESYCDLLVEEGVAREEVAKRIFITEKYKHFLWYQPVSIIKFWVKDQSDNFEKTDALIEKTVHLSSDLMRSNTIDSFFDLMKFRIQNII